MQILILCTNVFGKLIYIKKDFRYLIPFFKALTGCPGPGKAWNIFENGQIEGLEND